MISKSRIINRFALSAAAMSLMLATESMATIARFQFSLDGVAYAPVYVRLYDTAMPNTVENFVNYADDNDWDGSFIHRSARTGSPSVPFVIQGGGFKIPTTGMIDNGFLDLDSVPTDPPINDEPGGGVAGISNKVGTIAMAKSGPNTATNQWFFNLGDNSSLDNPNRPDGGFAAFGRVLGNGMQVIDAIAALPRINVGVSPVTEVPVKNITTVVNQGDIFNKDVPFIQNIDIVNVAPGDYNFDGVVNTADRSVWSSSYGSITDAAADGNGDGKVDLRDFLIWRNSLGSTGASLTLGSGGGMSIPEPTSLGLLGIAASACFLARKACPRFLRQRT